MQTETQTRTKRTRTSRPLPVKAPTAAARITAAPGDVNQKLEIDALVESNFARIKEYADRRELDDPRRLPTLNSALPHYLMQFTAAVLGASQSYTGGLVNFSGALFSYLDSFETAGRVRCPYTLSSGGAFVEGECITDAALDVLFTGRGVPALFAHEPGILVGFASQDGKLRLQPVPTSWLEARNTALLCELLEEAGLGIDPDQRNQVGSLLRSIKPIWQ
jgi:hypothetical protein